MFMNTEKTGSNYKKSFQQLLFGWEKGQLLMNQSKKRKSFPYKPATTKLWKRKLHLENI